MQDQIISLVVGASFSNEREALARRTTEEDIDYRVPKFRQFSKSLSRQTSEVALKGFTVWKVLLVHGDVNGVVVHSGNDLKAGLFESKGHTPGTAEQVNSNRTLHLSILKDL